MLSFPSPSPSHHTSSYTVFACFGGGIISPLLVNEPPFPLRHDLAIPYVALAFGLTRLKVWRAVVDIMPVKVAVGIAFECSFEYTCTVASGSFSFFFGGGDKTVQATVD